MNIKLLSAAGALLAATAVAHASESTDLTVTGTIAPSACSLSLPGGGSIDFGELKLQDIGGGKVAFRESTDTQFEISCSSATQLAMHYTDQTYAGVEMPQKNAFLLVAGDDGEIGYVEIRMENGQGDGNSLDFRKGKSDDTPANLVRADDKDAAMRMGWKNDPFSRISGTLHTTVISDGFDPSKIVDAAALSSRIGIELLYL